MEFSENQNLTNARIPAVALAPYPSKFNSVVSFLVTVFRPCKLYVSLTFDYWIIVVFLIMKVPWSLLRLYPQSEDSLPYPGCTTISTVAFYSSIKSENQKLIFFANKFYVVLVQASMVSLISRRCNCPLSCEQCSNRKYPSWINRWYHIITSCLSTEKPNRLFISPAASQTHHVFSLSIFLRK